MEPELGTRSSTKRPRLEIPWHAASDQPERIRDRRVKRRLRDLALAEYARVGATALLFAPLVALSYRRVATASAVRPRPAAKEFIGLALTPDSAPAHELVAMVEELDVRRLLVRIPVWQRDRLDELAAFLDRLPGREVALAVVQDRDSVCHPTRWRDDLRRIFARFAGRVHDYQIGLATNRSKWGCFHFGDYARLMEEAEQLRGEFPKARLLGPALIDFEPLAMVRALINCRRFRFDAVAALLYVDRRGPPGGRQLGYFDLARKIRLQAAIAALSPRLRPDDRSRLWITETNWPLADTGEHAPTSPKECVSEEVYADYLRGYYQQAYATGLVERVYWWQLVAAGYGLVDPRGGTLRRRPGYEVFRKLLSGEIRLGD